MREARKLPSEPPAPDFRSATALAARFSSVSIMETLETNRFSNNLGYLQLRGIGPEHSAHYFHLSRSLK
jgi:hypothetical protein